MSGYIFIDREGESGLRQEMRRSMRGGYRNYGSLSANMRGDYSEGYRMGYKHGWEDKEDDWMDEDEHYRRRRDSRGRFV